MRMIGVLLIAALSLVPVQVHAASLTVNWVDNAPNELGFKIERGPTLTGSFTEIATVLGPNVVSYVDTNIPDGTSWCYRLRAWNNSTAVPPVPQYSAYSNTACGTVPLISPNSLALSGTTSVSLVWVNGSANATGIEVERAPAAAGPFAKLGATLPSSATTYTDATANVPGTTYYYRVRAINATMPSVYSNTASITLPVGPPPAPSNLNVTPTALRPGASGTISSTPAGILGCTVGKICNAPFVKNTNVTLKAVPKQNSRLASWGGDAAGCSGSTCAVLMDRDKAVKVAFTK